MTNLFTRIVVAIVAIPTILWIVWFGGVPLLIFTIIIASLGLWEYLKLVSSRYQLQNTPGFILFSLGIPIVTYFTGESGLLIGLITSFSILAVALLATGRPQSSAIVLALTLFGIFYTTGLTSFLILIHDLKRIPEGSVLSGGRWLIFLFSIIWACDTMAYFIGKPFGKHKLSLQISPNKTAEGFGAGVLGGIIASIACQKTFLSSAPLIPVISLGILISLVGQLGDLLESALKRDCQVKDSSMIIPGHGGVLDRFDSLFFSLPFFYYYLKLILYR